MFEVTDVAMLVQAVSLAVAVACGLATSFYFAKRREDQETTPETSSTILKQSNLVPTQPPGAIEPSEKPESAPERKNRPKELIRRVEP